MFYVSRFRTQPLRGTPHLPLLLILLLFTLLTLSNSVLLPLGEAADETDHYQYLRFVARTGHPPLTQAERAEAGFKGGLAPLYYWLAAWPIALVGEETPPDIRRVDSRPERYIPTDGLGINHVLHTLDEQFPWRGQILAWHLVRFLSLPLGWVTIIAAYALARRLLPARKVVAIGAAAFIAFLPRFVISSAVINDDNLVFALTALLLLTQVIILQGNHRPAAFATMGALFGLALVTKYFSLILIPEILLTLVIFVKAARSRSTSIYRPLLAFLAALLVTAGPWFIFITLRFNRIEELGLIPGLAASLGEPQITEGLVGLLSGQTVRPPAATYGLAAWLSLLYRSFWFEYGWMQIFAPGWVYSLFTIILLVALGGILGWMLTKVSRATEDTFPFSFHRSPVAWLLGLHLALFLLVVLARYALSATIDTGQGRHLYPALPVIALLVALGLDYVGSSTFGAQASGKQPRHSLLPLARGAYLFIPILFFLLPALITLQPAAFILPRYQTLPVTITPPTELPISARQTISFGGGLALSGYEMPQSAAAGDVLPVTLYWRVGAEAERDYLISLCLQDPQDQPAACWRGHFVDGRYPARAWEAGDTVIDTVYIPLPTCYRLLDQPYMLHLELWPLVLDSPTPVLAETPALTRTFTGSPITLQPTDSTRDLPQTIGLWRRAERLTGPTPIEPGESIAQLTYAAGSPSPARAFQDEERDIIWKPLPQLDTALYLPCDDGPAPFARLAHFIADPTLPGGRYQPTNDETGPTLTYAPRSRLLAPLQSTLTFARLLAPLSLQLPDQPQVDLTQPTSTYTLPSYSLLPASPTLPVTLRWQTHRWMADPLVISLKLLDKDFAVGGERIATLGDRYPNVLWVPTEVVEESYPVQIEPDAPPGLYQLELSLIRQDETVPDGFEYLPLTDGDTEVGQNLYPVTIRLLDPAHDSPPPIPFTARLGDAIELVGYELNPKTKITNPKSSIELALYWQSTAKIPGDYTVFTQLIGPDGQLWAQWDNPPQADRYPTTAWAETDRVVDRYSLSLRDGAPPGEYRLLVGMYNPATGERLPATIEGQPQPDNAVELARLSLTL